MLDSFSRLLEIKKEGERAKEALKIKEEEEAKDAPAKETINVISKKRK
jgi:hypothetical protein